MLEIIVFIKEIQRCCPYVIEIFNLSISNLKNSLFKKISIAFHNGLNYDYNFHKKELEKHFTC